MFEDETPVLYAPVADRAAPSLSEVIGHQVPMSLAADPFATAINELPACPLHWVKIFMAHVEDDRRITELHLNNVDCPERAKLEALQCLSTAACLRYVACAVDPARLGRPPVSSA